MKVDLKSWLTGFLLGLCGKPLPFIANKTEEPEKTIIGYSYNGVVLPDINEVWTDKEAYPYAVVFKSIAYGFYMLVTSSTVFTTYIHSSLNMRVFSSGKSNYSRYTNESDPAQWAFIRSAVKDSLNFFVHSYSPVWANFDMIDTDTSAIYLAASEPTPVYE